MRRLPFSSSALRTILTCQINSGAISLLTGRDPLPLHWQPPLSDLGDYKAECVNLHFPLPIENLKVLLAIALILVHHLLARLEQPPLM